MTDTVTLIVDEGWRVRAIFHLAPWIGWLPDVILDRIVEWAVRGVRVAPKAG